jgi:hypothetical protein
MPSKEGASLDSPLVAGVSRELVTSDRAVEGWKGKIAGHFVEATFVHSVSLDVNGIHADDSGYTLTFETDDGAAYILGGAVSLDPPKTASGETKFKFGAMTCTPA